MYGSFHFRVGQGLLSEPEDFNSCILLNRAFIRVFFGYGDLLVPTLYFVMHKVFMSSDC